MKRYLRTLFAVLFAAIALLMAVGCNQSPPDTGDEGEPRGVIAVSGAELDALIAEGEPIVCDFWASWCGPCMSLAPILEELAEEFVGRATFVKVNVDENGQTAAKYGVSSIPDVFVFENGVQKAHRLGYASKEVMRNFLESYL